MVTPRATALSRASVTREPWLFAPSPEMSITRREARKPLEASRSMLKSRASEMDVPDLR